MNVLAIDASSTAIGMACGPNPQTAPHMRLIVPPKDFVWHERMSYATKGICQFIEDCQPTHIVLEDLGGYIKVGGASTQKYAAAVGHVHCLCDLYAEKLGFNLHMIKPTTWTKGGRKSKRQAMAHFMFDAQGYATWSDPGGDLSDALMLMSWMHDHLKTEELKAQAK